MNENECQNCKRPVMIKGNKFCSDSCRVEGLTQILRDIRTRTYGPQPHTKDEEAELRAWVYNKTVEALGE